MPNYELEKKNLKLNFNVKKYDSFEEYLQEIETYWTTSDQKWYNECQQVIELNTDNIDIVKDNMNYMLTLQFLNREKKGYFAQDGLAKKHDDSFMLSEIEFMKKDVLEAGVLDKLTENRSYQELYQAMTSKDSKVFKAIMEEAYAGFDKYYEKKIADEKMKTADDLKLLYAQKYAHDGKGKLDGKEINVTEEEYKKAKAISQAFYTMSVSIAGTSGLIFGGPFDTELGKSANVGFNIKLAGKGCHLLEGIETSQSNHSLYQSQKAVMNLGKIWSTEIDATPLRDKNAYQSGLKETAYQRLYQERKQATMEQGEEVLETASNYLGVNLMEGLNHAKAKYQKMLDDHKLKNEQAKATLQERGLPTAEQLIKKTKKEKQEISEGLYVFNDLYFPKGNPVSNEILKNTANLCIWSHAAKSDYPDQLPDDYSLLQNLEATKNLNTLLQKEIPTPKNMKERGYGDTMTIFAYALEKKNEDAPDLEKFDSANKAFHLGCDEAVQKVVTERKNAKETRIERARKEKTPRLAEERKKAEERLKKDAPYITEIQKMGYKTREELELQYLEGRAMERDGFFYYFDGVEYQTNKENAEKADNLRDNFYAMVKIVSNVSDIFNEPAELHSQAWDISSAFSHIYYNKRKNNKELLKDYKELSKVQQLFEKEMDTPEKYKAELGDKATVYDITKAYLKENDPKLAAKMDEGFAATEELTGMKIDLSKIKAREIQREQEKLAREQEKQAWENERRAAVTERNKRNEEFERENAPEPKNQIDTMTHNTEAASLLNTLLPTLALKKHFFGGTKNRSLTHLRELTQQFVTKFSHNADAPVPSDEERVTGLLEIKEEAKRMSAKKPEAQAILEKVDFLLSRKLNMDTLNEMEEKAEKQNTISNDWVVVNKEKSQAEKDLQDIVWNKENALGAADFSFIDTKASFEEKKNNAAIAVSEIIAGKMYEKAVSQLPSNAKPSEEEMLEAIREQGKAIRERADFQHMMRDVIEPQDLIYLQAKAISGNQLIDELAKHTKAVKQEEKKARVNEPNHPLKNDGPKMA